MQYTESAISTHNTDIYSSLQPKAINTALHYEYEDTHVQYMIMYV